MAWAASVKARRRLTMPALWLFTDAARHDVLTLAARLPPALCGIVFRHDGTPGRAALAHALARLCRARRIVLTVAGDWRLAAALGAGRHLRLSRGERTKKCHRIVTASAHTGRELARASAAGADLVFLSPVFATASHPGAPALGVRKFGTLSRACAVPVLALGGIDGASARRLPKTGCAGAGAIGAFGSPTQRRVGRVTPT